VDHPPLGWREAMRHALYGPAGHFRTSAHVRGTFAAALARLLAAVDDALGRPDRLDVVDVGAGRGELLTDLLDAVPPDLAARLRPVAVERAPRPARLDPRIAWAGTAPTRITGLVVANEWLDNVPLDVVETAADGSPRYVLVRPDGTETAGDPVGAADRAWLDRWWPLRQAPPGVRAELGSTRDAAWADLVARLDGGLAVAVDYGHLRERRPPLGTLTGFRAGAQVAPVPDGTRDLTAHVAVDAVAAAGRGDRPAPLLVRQRDALRRLGVDGRRPALGAAAADPAGYLRDLARASAAAELTEPDGLGGYWWVLQPDPRTAEVAAALAG
jgi:SAM-dependent MidA family methyltransferase